MAENYYDQDTSLGIITADTSTIQADVEEEIKAIFGNNIDLSAETPQGRLAEVLTAERAGVVGFNAANATQMNIDYATGLFLDAIASRFRVSRIGATRSRVYATLTGTAGTIIPAGSIAKSGENEFYAENDITLPVIGAYFLSSETGEVPCPAGTLTTIVSSVIGWTGITNSSEPSVFGADQETDTAFRIRIKDSRYSGTGFVEDIGAALNGVDELVSSFVYDNGTGGVVVYDTVSIDAHSIVVVVDGGSDADIAQVIFENKSAGCGYTSIDGEAVVTFSDVGNDGEIVTVDGVVYRLKSTMAQAYDVQIGASANATAVSLSHAINLDGTVGVDYFAGTAANATCSSSITGTGEATIVGGTYGAVIASTDSTEAAIVINSVPQATTSYVVDGAYSVSYPVTFNRPLDVDIEIEITASAGSISASELEASVKAAIALWASGGISGIDGLSIGQDVSPFEIAAAVSNEISSIYISKCEIALLGGSLAPTSLEIHVDEIARIAQGDISVVVV